MSAEPVVSARDLRKAYMEAGREVPVLEGVDLEIGAGEQLAIVGRSGSGKTTLLNLLGGLDRSYTGSLRVHGHELSRLDDRAIAAFRNQTVGFVYQSFHLLPHLSARQNVSLPSFFRAGGRADPADVRRRAGRCLDRVGLEHAAERHPLHLSGGERQRVAIARALFQEPRLILCDEPTGSLDSETGEHILGLFAELNRELGVTVVMVTHEPSVAARADRVVRVQDGRVVEAAP